VLDLATANQGSATVSILLGNGDGTFGAQTTYAVGTGPLSVTPGDFNGDTVLDLATANQGSNTVSILLGIGDGTFGAQTTYAVGTSPYSVTSGDFSGDTVLDLATANASSNTVSILLGSCLGGTGSGGAGGGGAGGNTGAGGTGGSGGATGSAGAGGSGGAGGAGGTAGTAGASGAGGSGGSSSAFSITRVSGDGQSGTVGLVLGLPLVVRVTDGGGAPAPDVPVVWAALTVGGSVTPVGATTDAQGLAQTTATLSNTAGVNNHTFRARVDEPGGPAVSFVASAFEPISAAVPAPVAVAQVTPPSGLAPLTVTLDGSASSADPSGSLVGYTWTLGDGSVVEAAGATATHTFEQPGSYGVTLEVTDSFGQSASDDSAVVVSGASGFPPLAGISADVVSGPVPLTVRFGCACSDLDGEVVVTAWEFGNGLMSDQRAPVFTFQEAGRYEVRLTVEDDDGLEGYDSVSVLVTDGPLLPPVGKIITSAIRGDTPLQVDMSAYVRDDDGAVVATRWRIFGGPEGTPEVTATTEDVRHIFAVAGAYTVSLEVEDNDGLLAYDQLTIQVGNAGVRPPRIVSSPNLTATVGVPYSYDEDGLPSAQGTRPLDWDLGRAVGGATVNIPSGMTIPPGSSEIRWTPTADQVGEHPVSLSATNTAGTDFQDFTITVAPAVGNPPAGCSCSSQSAPDVLLLLGLVGLAMRVRRRMVRSC
jgi:MYXO-CTERM domain-containing protein